MYEEVLRLGLSTGLSETYWKVYLLNYNENQDTWEKGEYIYTAHSWIGNLYPEDDIYLGYWYTKTSTEFKSSYYIDKQEHHLSELYPLLFYHKGHFPMEILC